MKPHIKNKAVMTANALRCLDDTVIGWCCFLMGEVNYVHRLLATFAQKRA